MLQRPIEQKINLMLTRVGIDIFEASQKSVPVCTGRLKRNALIKLNRNVIEIQYNTPYASFIEFGSTGSDYTRPKSYTTQVRSHSRITKSGKRVSVQAHEKTFVGGKPIKCADGRWAVIDTTKPYKGRFYLTKAVSDVFRKTLGKRNGLQAYVQ